MTTESELEIENATRSQAVEDPPFEIGMDEVLNPKIDDTHLFFTNPNLGSSSLESESEKILNPTIDKEQILSGNFNPEISFLDDVPTGLENPFVPGSDDVVNFHENKIIELYQKYGDLPELDEEVDIDSLAEEIGAPRTFVEFDPKLIFKEFNKLKVQGILKTSPTLRTRIIDDLSVRRYINDPKEIEKLSGLEIAGRSLRTGSEGTTTSLDELFGRFKSFGSAVVDELGGPAAGVNDVVSGLGASYNYLADLFNIPEAKFVGDKLIEIGDSNVENILENLSPEVRESLERPLTIRKENPTDFGDATLAPFLDFIVNSKLNPEFTWADLFRQSLRQIPSTAATVLPGGAVVKGAQVLRLGKAAQKVAGTITIAASEGLMSAGAAKKAIHQAIIKAPQEALDASPAYQELINAEMDEQSARKALAESISTKAGTKTGVTTALLGAPMSVFFAKLFTEKLGKNAALKFLTSFLGEGLQEGGQAIAEVGIESDARVDAGLSEISKAEKNETIAKSAALSAFQGPLATTVAGSGLEEALTRINKLIKAGENSKALIAMVEIAKESKLFKENPKDFKTIVTGVLGHGKGNKLQISLDVKIYNKAIKFSGLDNSTVARELNIEDQLIKVGKANGWLIINTADLIPLIATNEKLADRVVPHLKFNPDEMSFSEARRHLGRMVEPFDNDITEHQKNLAKGKIASDKDEEINLAPNGQKSNLTPEQKAVINTPEFREFFGDYINFAKATMRRKASTSDQTNQEAKKFIGKPLLNKSTKLQATVSNSALRKMMSGKAQKKSFSREAHIQAVANVDSLFLNATLRESHLDRKLDRNIRGLHRVFAPMIFEGKVLMVKLTVKSFVDQGSGNQIYTVEGIEIEEPASVASSPKGNADKGHEDQKDPGNTSHADSSITNILRDVEKINPQEFARKVDENGEPLPSEIQKFLNRKRKNKGTDSGEQN